MSSEKDLRYERVSLYSAALVFGEGLQPDILNAIDMTSKSNLDIGGICIVGPGPKDVTLEGAKRIKDALKRADTKADSFSTGSPGLWIFDPNDPQISKAREIAHNCNGLFTYRDDKHTPEFTAAYKIASIIQAIDLAVMVDQGRFVTFHVGDFTGACAEDILTNLYIVAEYARAKGVRLGLERGEVPSAAMVDYVQKVNAQLGAQLGHFELLWVNNDTANPYIWGSGEDPLEGSRTLKGAGVVYGEHIKGAAPREAVKTAWQADECEIYDANNTVKLVEELKMSMPREVLGGDHMRLTLESELHKNKSPQDNYAHVKRSIDHMVKCMIDAGYRIC